jgi:hypothetical protein
MMMMVMMMKLAPRQAPACPDLTCKGVCCSFALASPIMAMILPHSLLGPTAVTSSRPDPSVTCRGMYVASE